MDPSIYRFIYIVLAILSIMLPGTTFRIISFVVALILLMLKIRDYRERPEENALVVFDIMGIILIIVIDVVLVIMGAVVENQVNNMFPSSSYSDEKSSASFSELANRYNRSF